MRLRRHLTRAQGGSSGAPEAMGAVTNWAPMPDRLVPMLAELGITMTYGSVIQGGAEFSAHAANPTTMAEIANPTYDIVNFQSSYDDAGDAAAYTTAVRPLYTAAHNAGAIALFEGIWEFGGFGSYELDYGGPVDPAAENAVEGAVNDHHGRGYTCQEALRGLVLSRDDFTTLQNQKL